MARFKVATVGLAVEIRLRAERRAGELVKQMEKAKGRQSKNPSTGTRGSPKTLAELGVSYDQSSKWQKLADIPQGDFEESLAADRPSTTGIIKAVEPKKVKPMDPTALWLWGHLRACAQTAGAEQPSCGKLLREPTPPMPRPYCRWPS
jgi:hypothetical protein